MAFLAASASLPSIADTPSNTLVIAQDIEGIISLDPAEAFEELSLQMTGVLYDRLFAYDPKSETRLRPQIAESWSASADGKVYTFKLKPGLTFASGNPLTSEDVVYSIRRTL
ncbi:MAG TPA: ABC transporter substrate-binding protein, partial [Stellaceae bacterium]|nr:ABC transporter substrate-binding protein [Stellaceae bacterium]